MGHWYKPYIMNLDALLAQLRTEREMLEEAILALERIAQGTGRRRGRPPKWLRSERAEPPVALTPAKKPRLVSITARKKMAAAQRKRWAAKRQTE